MSPTVRDWVEREQGAPITRVRRLAGASTSAVHMVWLADGRRAVLRRYVWPGFLDAEPDAPRREAESLRLAGTHDLPVPAVLASDPDGSVTGDGVPALLMTVVPGRAVGVPDLHRLAEAAAAIHAVDAAALGHEYSRWHVADTTGPPTGAADAALWERAVELWGTAMPRYRPAFVHRDFHPGNVLWSRGRAGVVDWANACRGPSGCDVAHCRDNLLRLAGQEAADRFLSAYQSLTGETLDPYWEVASVLEHSPTYWTPERIRRSERRLRAAVEAYGTH